MLPSAVVRSARKPGTSPLPLSGKVRMGESEGGSGVVGGGGAVGGAPFGGVLRDLPPLNTAHTAQVAAIATMV